jgi:hypothetical protein
MMGFKRASHLFLDFADRGLVGQDSGNPNQLVDGFTCYYWSTSWSKPGD